MRANYIETRSRERKIATMVSISGNNVVVHKQAAHDRAEASRRVYRFIYRRLDQREEFLSERIILYPIRRNETFVNFLETIPVFENLRIELSRNKNKRRGKNKRLGKYKITLSLAKG